MLIICIHISSICSSVNVIIDSCLLFFDDHSVMVSLLLLMSLIWNVCILLGYEPADLTVHPPPPELPRVGSFFSYRCLVFPKKCPQRKACAFLNY